METRRSLVAGISYPNADGTTRIHILRDYARQGISVFLEPEPKNKFDNHAIGLWIDTASGRQQIGYVPSSERVVFNIPLNTDLPHTRRTDTVMCKITKVLELDSKSPRIHPKYQI